MYRLIKPNFRSPFFQTNNILERIELHVKAAYSIVLAMCYETDPASATNKEMRTGNVSFIFVNKTSV